MSTSRRTSVASHLRQVGVTRRAHADAYSGTGASTVAAGSRSSFLRAAPLAALFCVAFLMLAGGIARASTPVFLSSFTGAATPAGSFSSVSGVAVDESSGDVYVVDAGHNALDKFTASGTYLCQITGNGSSASECDSATHGPEAFSFSTTGPRPVGVAVDNSSTDGRQGYVYVADPGHNAVDVFSSSGAYVGRLAGETTAFSEPLGVAVDGAGDVFVMTGAGNTTAARLYEFNSSGGFVSPGGEATVGAGTGPYGIAVNRAGTSVYAVLSPKKIYEYVVSGWVRTERVATPKTFIGIAVEPASGDVYGVKEGATGVAAYEPPAFTKVGEFGISGEVTSGAGIAINGSTGYVYVTDQASPNRVDVFGPPPSAPEIDAESAAAITPASATLEAKVNPEHELTTYQFQYVEEAAYDPVAPNPYGAGATLPLSPAEVGSGSFDVTVARNTGAVLTPDTTYHYRVVATNPTGTTKGADETFLTAPPYPATGACSGATQTELTLGGSFNPGGIATTYKFNYGTSAAYGSSTTASSPQGGTSPVAASAQITNLAPNTTYHYQLTVSNGTTSSLGADRTCSTLPLAPAAQTFPLATGLGAEAAGVHGSVTPQGAATSYWVEYVTQAQFEQGGFGAAASTAEVQAGSGQSVVPVAVALEGLAPATTYHFRLVAVNAGGTADGNEQTLSTHAGLAPAAATGGASGLGATTATLHGTLNPRGSDTSYRFQYGMTAAYGSSSAEVEAGQGTGAEGVSAALGALAPATTYHYRLVAVNTSGVDYGADRTFATAAALPAPVPPTPTPKPKPLKCRKGFVKKNGRCVKKPVKHQRKTAHKKRHNRHAHNDWRDDR